MSSLFIGLISGTSADGIDAALVEFSDEELPRVIQTLTLPYPDLLKMRVEQMIDGGNGSLRELVELDIEIGDAFAAAAMALLTQAGIDVFAVSAIGSHGQTVFHLPGYSTMQLGEPSRIAARVGLPVVADFRRGDMACGGQGAPLAPLLHAALFAKYGETRVVVNLGGIANVTILHGDGNVSGFDTGPANTLMDGWAQRCKLGGFDRGGALAARGKVLPELLDAFLQDPYFALAPPKSTGRELFNMQWLDRHLDGVEADNADIQATLCELTASTVSAALQAHAPAGAPVFVCGGGVHNGELMARIAENLPESCVETTADLGINPDFVEAVLFAWLAHERIHARSPSGLMDVTGAQQPAVLGGVWLPPRA